MNRSGRRARFPQERNFPDKGKAAKVAAKETGQRAESYLLCHSERVEESLTVLDHASEGIMRSFDELRMTNWPAGKFSNGPIRLVLRAGC
jgi:hypothetical protein